MDNIVEQIIEILSKVVEPNTGKDLIHLRMIRDIHVEGKNIHLKVYLPANNYDKKDILFQDIQDSLTKNFADHEIHAHFVNQTAYSEAPNALLPQIKNFVAVASGKGGVGKSTVAVNLAIALSRLGYKTGILDADLYGPSLPTMFGIKKDKPQIQLIDGKHQLIPILVQGLPVLSLGNIIEADQAVVLRGPRLAAIIKQFFQDAQWPELDYLIIDLPPGTGDVQLTLVQTVPLTGVVMVTTPQEVAIIDAIKAANMFSMEQIKVPILGVIENMSWFQPLDQPDKKYFIFGQNGGQRLAHITHSSLIGQVPLIEKIRQRSDEGLAFELDEHDIYPALFESMAIALHKKVELRNLTLAPTKKVEQA